VEALVVIGRYITDECTIEQRVLSLNMLAKSMKGEETARELINTLSVVYGVSSQQPVAGMRDRASVNNVAMRTLQIVYPTLLTLVAFPTHSALLESHSRLLLYLSSWFHGYPCLHIVLKHVSFGKKEHPQPCECTLQLDGGVVGKL